MVAVRLGLRTRRKLGSVVASGPERRADPLAPGDPLDREPDVDGQAYAVADGHVQRLDAARRVNRHGVNSATSRTTGRSIITSATGSWRRPRAAVDEWRNASSPAKPPS